MYTPTDQAKLRILAVVGVLFALAFAVLLNQAEPVRVRSDFAQLWFAGKNLLTEGRNLYSTQNGVELIEFTGIATNPYEGNFYYPAHLFVLYAPLAALPFATAHLIWTIFIQLGFFAGLWLLMRAAGWPRAANPITLLLMLSALFIPHLQNTIFGQVNTLAVLGIGLAYYFLRSERYALAGAATTLLTYKPQASLAPLVFLLLWALLERRRWRLLLGFGIAGLTHWALAELFQRGWVPAFISGLANYRFIPFNFRSVLDAYWNPGQALAILLGIGWLALVLRYRRAQPDSPAFHYLLVLSYVLGWLALPLVGMSNMVAAPAALILLFAALQPHHPRLYRYGLLTVAAIYLLGLILFILGLSIQYGLQIDLTQPVYKGLLSLALLALALPALLQSPVDRLPSRASASE